MIRTFGSPVSGMAAALEAKKAGLKFLIVEATEKFSTIVNFPKGKHIFTYPTDMVPAGDLQFHADTKEGLVEEITAQTIGVEVRKERVDRVAREGGTLKVYLNAQKGMPMETLPAQRVIVAIGLLTVSAGDGGLGGSAMIGRRTTNSLPCPTPALWASTVPSCISTRLFTSVRPIPNPLTERSSDVSICTNISKMRGSWSAAMPMPLSRNRITARLPSRATVRDIWPPL
jgi:hypothetical protein